MVKAADVEGLIQKYVEKGELERADALYLLSTVLWREHVASTLRVRYGRSGAISSVLADLDTLGFKGDFYVRTEDTNEYLNKVVIDFFLRACLGKVLEAAKAKANNLSQTAREVLYLISAMWPDSIDKRDLRRAYRLLFSRDIGEKELDKVLEELIGCYVIQYVSADGGLLFPHYFDTLLRELQSILPKVEVNVCWPEGAR
jgi:hypothetical protein